MSSNFNIPRLIQETRRESERLNKEIDQLNERISSREAQTIDIMLSLLPKDEGLRDTMRRMVTFGLLKIGYANYATQLNKHGRKELKESMRFVRNAWRINIFVRKPGKDGYTRIEFFSK